MNKNPSMTLGIPYRSKENFIDKGLFNLPL